jgi:hypothetical protein
MKNSTLLRLWAALLLLLLQATGLFANGNMTVYANNADSLSFEHIYVDFDYEMRQLQAEMKQELQQVTTEINATEHEIANTAGRSNKRYKKALEHKIFLLEKQGKLEAAFQGAALKVRYRKGIDLIKLMYEKILGLDHHFTGMQTFQNVSMLSNPNSYPEFEKAKEALEKNANKKFNMALPSLLNSNPFISGAFTLVSAMLSERPQKAKETDFEQIACILDFTVRMNADLSVVRNETEFLKQANQTMMEGCEKLFEEYTKAVQYHVPLEKCRGNDDWETLQEMLDKKIQEMEQQLMANPTAVGASKDQINLEFATQRVSEFISKYSTFIAQGTQYYQKFDNIVSNYENEDVCKAQLPRQFTELKFDIKSTIEKFNNTYNLPEIQGSRLKDLLYGLN